MASLDMDFDHINSIMYEFSLLEQASNLFKIDVGYFINDLLTITPVEIEVPCQTSRICLTIKLLVPLLP